MADELGSGAVTPATRLLGELTACSPDDLSLLDVQALTAFCARAYASVLDRGLVGDPVAPDAITATDAVNMCRGLMAAADIELFELSMWGAIQPAGPNSEGSDDHGRP